MKSPIKWAGGKSWLAPTIGMLYQPHRNLRFVEPFCGSCAVTIALKPPAALCADSLWPLINLFQVLQDPGLEIEAGGKISEQKYYRLRTQYNRTLQGRSEWNEGERRFLAETFYRLNRSCFNGLYRVNAQGRFNVPWGRYKTPVPEIEEQARRAISAIRFKCQPWEDTIAECTNDFIYSDPPYDDGFSDYMGSGFGWDDQVLLAAYLAIHRGPVVASNKATPRIVALYKGVGFKVRYVNGPRRISCTGDRKPEREILATKNL